MFAGHYAASLAAKAIEPRAPMWTLIAGAQLVDIGWSALIIAGIEKGSSDPSLPGSPLVLAYMPWTHSLPGALAWSVVALLLARYVLRLPMRAAITIGLVVFSHWLTDLLVHRPDLQLYPDGPKVGFGLWNVPVLEQAVEIGLLGIAGMFWAAQRVRAGLNAWPAAAFLILLVVVQIIGMLMPAEVSDTLTHFGPTALAVYIMLTVVAVFLDGRRPGTPKATA